MTDKYDTNKEKAVQTLTEGEKRLIAAQEAVNVIKKEIQGYQQDCETFVEAASRFYQDVAGNQTTDMTIWERAKSLATRTVTGDFKKRKIGDMFKGLVDSAEGINKKLGESVGENEEYLNKADETIDDLLNAMTECAEEVKQLKEIWQVRKTDYNNTVTDYNAALEQKTHEEIVPIYKRVAEAEREKERAKEDVLEKHTKLKQLQQHAEFLTQYRRNMSTTVSEARKFHRQIQTETETLRPLYKQLAATAGMVETQKKTLDMREGVKKVANALVVVAAEMTTSMAQRVSEVQQEKFMEGRTILALKALDDEARAIAEERDRKLMNAEGKVDPTQLFQKAQVDNSDIIDMREQADGSFKAENFAKAGKED